MRRMFVVFVVVADVACFALFSFFVFVLFMGVKDQFTYCFFVCRCVVVCLFCYLFIVVVY